MSRRTFLAALYLTALSLDAPSAWTALSCFAYSAPLGKYACLDFALSADDWPGEVRPMDFEQWRAPHNVAWSGHKAITLVGARASTSIVIAQKDHDRTRSIARPHAARDTLRELEKRGYRQRV